ncbi:MAG TPA: AbiV family abortive infection protein [Blastocatellia bacterium]
MNSKKLDQYKGKLTPSQIAEGMNSAIRNARRLLDDAEILFKANRFASSISLAILAIEEAGKSSILRGLAVARDNQELAQGWRDYRSHIKKNVSWMFIDLFRKGARKLDDFGPLFEENADHPYLLDQIKQIGFYTDCLGKAHWSNPEEVINEELTKSLIEAARVLCSGKMVTTEEIELWIKHLGPVWKSKSSIMKTALADWYSEMQARGLAAEGTNQMSKFINEGLELIFNSIDADLSEKEKEN